MKKQKESNLCGGCKCISFTEDEIIALKEIVKEENPEKKIQELKMKLWFEKNELYSDGSNVYDWLPDLKKKIESIFEVKLEEEKEK